MLRTILSIAMLFQGIPFPGPGRAPWGGGGGGGISVVNTSVAQDASGGSSTTVGISATSHTSGNLLVVGCRNSTEGATTASDSAGNTYTALTMYTRTSAGVWQWHYAKNITGSGANVVTCTTGAGTQYRAIIVYQVAGCSTTSPLDASADVGGGGSTNTPTSPSFSTVTADSIIFFGANVGAFGITWTAGSIGGVTATLLPSAGSDPIAAAEYRIVSSTQTGITADMSVGGSNQNMAYGVAVFK